MTVGSTLFPLLTNKILSRTILEILVSLGVTSLTVQYGRGDLPKDFETYVSLIDQHGSQDPGRLVCIYGEELQIEVFRFTNDFDRYVEVSEAIISHAGEIDHSFHVDNTGIANQEIGSGSILSALRKRPPIPLLVVANTSLMDNHQSELADALESQGYLSVSSPE